MTVKADAKVNTEVVYGHFINGRWIDSHETFSVNDKYTGQELAHIGKATRQDVTNAITHALENVSND